MAPVATQNEESKHFEPRNNVVENARSKVVLLSTDSSSAFNDFEPVPLPAEDISRCPVRAKRFDIGKRSPQNVYGPVFASGKNI